MGAEWRILKPNAEESSEKDQLGCGSMSSARVMVVDDDPQIRRVLRTALVAQGYEAIDARNGEEAIERLGEEKPDLIILDVNMPRMNGIETCRVIRSMSDVRIIMLTVRDSESDKIEALDAGADDYVTKPFSSPELLARIRAALRRSSQLTPEMQVVRLGDIEINFNLRRVVVGEREARLTPKEFDLLQYLVGHPNVPITHTTLLQSVWGADYGEEVEYLRVFVNQLRKKIEKNPSSPKYLLTEPWVGYRFRLPE
jgi:two-component system KDP operon response regulator KdpE